MTYIYYLCDRKACDYSKMFENQCDMCHHTSNVNHAINGPAVDPRKHPERFESIIRDRDTLYIEKEGFRKI